MHRSPDFFPPLQTLLTPRFRHIDRQVRIRSTVLPAHQPHSTTRTTNPTNLDPPHICSLLPERLAAHVGSVLADQARFLLFAIHNAVPVSSCQESAGVADQLRLPLP
jgi:hypothetical protein